jgi:hypothetical protein
MNYVQMKLTELQMLRNLSSGAPIAFAGTDCGVINGIIIAGQM